MGNTEDLHQEESQGTEEVAEESSRTTGPMGVLFAPDFNVWNEARRLITDKNIRVEDLAICCTQDPIIVTELLKSANAMFFSAGRTPITSTKTAIVRLGSDTVLEIFERIGERKVVDDEKISKWIETHRSRCRRTSIVARILSEALSRTLSDDCQAAGLLMHVGDMLAAKWFGTEYVELAEELPLNSVNYRLIQNNSFNSEKMGANFLRKNGIPEALLFAIDRDATNRVPERSIIRTIVQSASELVDAFDTNKWEKYAPGKNLPGKSPTRLLGIDQDQYLKLYERAAEFLFSARLLEQRRTRSTGPEDFSTGANEISTEAPVKPEISNEQQALESDIQNLLFGTEESVETPKVEDPIADAFKDIDEDEADFSLLDDVFDEFDDLDSDDAGVTSMGLSSVEYAEEETKIEELEEDFGQADQFDLKKDSQPKRMPRVLRSRSKQTPSPKLATKSGTKIVKNLAKAFDRASSSEEVLTNLLAKLVDDGPFEKSALIVVSRDRKNAIVVAARGPNIGNGQKIELSDPLSPLGQCFSKVRSFSTKPNEASPFGSKTFALAPIDADHETPVALYADCGDASALTFEARRVFRTIVELLNERLPQMPGGIPVELEEQDPA